MKTTSDALKIINSMMKNDPELQEMVRESSISAQVADIVYQARESAGLSQEQLAELVGINPSVIAKLEDAEDLVDCLSILAKITVALDWHLEIRLIPKNVALA
jgi:ribosome-binding protein aMBF1 (putative translation factor)